jgi:hypothetical protein
VAAHRRQVDERNAIGVARGDREGHVDRDGRGPDATLGRVDGDQTTTGPLRGGNERARSKLLGSPMAQVEGLDARVELALVHRPEHDVVGARLEEPDSLLDIVGRADREAGDLRQLGDGPKLAAHLGERAGRWDDIDDDDVVVRGARGELVRALDSREGSTGAAENLGQRFARGGTEEQDAGIGHGAP